MCASQCVFLCACATLCVPALWQKRNGYGTRHQARLPVEWSLLSGGDVPRFQSSLEQALQGAGYSTAHKQREFVRNLLRGIGEPTAEQAIKYSGGSVGGSTAGASAGWVDEKRRKAAMDIPPVMERYAVAGRVCACEWMCMCMCECVRVWVNLKGSRWHGRACCRDQPLRHSCHTLQPARFSSSGKQCIGKAQWGSFLLRFASVRWAVLHLAPH